MGSSDDSDDIITGVTTLLYEDDGFITNDIVNLSSLQFLHYKDDNNNVKDNDNAVTFADNNIDSTLLEDNSNTAVQTITEKLLNIHNEATSNNDNDTFIESCNSNNNEDNVDSHDIQEDDIASEEVEKEENYNAIEENENNNTIEEHENKNYNNYDADDISCISDISLSTEEDVDLQTNNKYQE